MRTIYFFMFMGLSFALLSATNGSFKAYVDDNAIEKGDSIKLSLEVNGRASGEPELTELRKSFDIVSRANSSETSIINGVSTQKTKLILELSPKSDEKNLRIPPIKWGDYESDAIAITQNEVSATSAAERGLSLVASVNRQKLYVGAELVLNLELKTSRPLRSGNLAKPELADAIVESLSERDEEVVEGGIHYQVFRRSYAIFPSKTGELTIPSIRFDGLVADESSRGWFSSGRRMSARSQDLKVAVLPIPEAFPRDKPFLALRNLVLVESFDEADPKFEINKATTRRFEIKALSALSSSLPLLDPPNLAGLKVYSEPGLSANKNTEDGMEASVKFSHVYMPIAPGKFHVPAQTIYWWDIDEDKLKTTEMRAFDFEVGGQAVAEAPSLPREEELLPNTESPKVSREDQPERSDWWIYVAAALGLLWLMTLGLWFWQARAARGKMTEPVRDTTLEESFKDLVKAAKTADASLLYQELSAFSKQASLNADLRTVIEGLRAELEEVLYNPSLKDKCEERGREIAQRVAAIKIDSSKNGGLSKLYPY